jgi:hypothetical protein
METHSAVDLGVNMVPMRIALVGVGVIRMKDIAVSPNGMMAGPSRDDGFPHRSAGGLWSSIAGAVASGAAIKPGEAFHREAPTAWATRSKRARPLRRTRLVRS